jgi:Hint domain
MYANNVNPDMYIAPSVNWFCRPNPCAGTTLSCDCGQPACAGYPSNCVAYPPSKLSCAFYAVCASPDTRIATPKGERRIAELAPGDLVYSADRGSLRAVPILHVGRTAVWNHHVVELRMADGAVLEMSAGHPTADGRIFGDLATGDLLDGVRVVSASIIPYRHAYTYDILPASDTGSYVAEGRLIGSTLR